MRRWARKVKKGRHKIDSVDVFSCFIGVLGCLKKRDVVKAAVVALRGARSYELGTGGIALRVLHAMYATSEGFMVPISWTERNAGARGF